MEQTLFKPSSRQVRAIRAWMGMKQPVFARNCGVSHSALADFELGRRATSAETLNSIAVYVATLPVEFNKDGNLKMEV